MHLLVSPEARPEMPTVPAVKSYKFPTWTCTPSNLGKDRTLPQFGLTLVTAPEPISIAEMPVTAGRLASISIIAAREAHRWITMFTPQR